MWYYGCYHRGNKYIIVTNPCKTEAEAWKCFNEKDKYLHESLHELYMNEFYGLAKGVLRLNKHETIEKGCSGWTLILDYTEV